MQKIRFATDVMVTDCCVCGGPIAMTDTMHSQYLRTHNLFYCAAGHTQHYTGEPKEERLRADLVRSDGLLRESRARSDELLGVVGKKEKEIKRMNRRAGAGVCGFCRRHFANVERHVGRKHPKDYPGKAPAKDAANIAPEGD